MIRDGLGHDTADRQVLQNTRKNIMGGGVMDGGVLMIRALRLLAIAVFTLVSSLGLIACGSTPVHQDLSAVKRVGVLNLFQDLPSYSKFTLTNDVIASAELPESRQYLSRKMIEALQGVGIQGYEVRDHLPLLRGEVDVILELQPRLANADDAAMGIRYSEPVDNEGRNGYGFFYKSLLLVQRGPDAYFGMRVAMIENQGGSLEKAQVYDASLSEPLDIEKLPNSWKTLSDAEKQALAAGLRRAIDEGVTTLVDRMGF